MISLNYIKLCAILLLLYVLLKIYKLDKEIIFIGKARKYFLKLISLFFIIKSLITNHIDLWLLT